MHMLSSYYLFFIMQLFTMQLYICMYKNNKQLIFAFSLSVGYAKP